MPQQQWQMSLQLSGNRKIDSVTPSVVSVAPSLLSTAQRLTLVLGNCIARRMKILSLNGKNHLLLQQ
jgi:hypothetical protein